MPDPAQSRLKELPEEDQKQIFNLSMIIMEHVYTLVSKLRDCALPVNEFEIYHHRIRVKLWDNDPEAKMPEVKVNKEEPRELPQGINDAFKRKE